jgi:hypothetical protein
MTRRRHPAIALLLVALALLAPASRVTAQSDLPPEITRATSLTAEQTREIEKFVGEAMARFNAQPPVDRQEVGKGREALLRQLKGREISVAFRQAYSQILVPKLQPLAGDPDDLRVANALIVGGELATTDSVALAERALNHEKSPVRSAACYAIGRTFDAVTTASPAIFKDRLEGLTGKLGDVVRKDTEPLVVLEAIKALGRAMNVDRAGMESVRVAGLAALDTAVRDRAKAAAAGKVPEILLQGLTNAAQAARESMAQNNPQLALSPEGMKQAAELNGHLLALIIVRMQAKDFPEGDTAARELPAQAVSVAETAIGLAAQKAGSTQPLPRGLAAEFKKATREGDAAFFRSALELLRVLQRPPFGFPPGTFLKNDDKPPAP